MTAECPSMIELEAFATGESADARLAAHVGDCGDCRRHVEQVRANNALLAELVSSRADRDGGEVAGPPEIPGYAVEGELHRGGQGVVYRARQIATHRTVALKVLLAGAFATSRQRRRFEREIELVAGLRHPNIVTVYDSGATEDGRLWFAMEYLDEVTLADWIEAEHRQAGAVPRAAATHVRRMLKLFAKICDAVGHAHRRGVIHRDLKPSNVAVEGGAEPRVLDFGLAKPVDPTVDRERATVTGGGGFLGTLAYASPEQMSGDPAAVDVRSDVYSLGVILYEMLTGEYPYPVTGRMSDVIDAITRQPPRPLRTLPAPRRRVDDEVETILRKALSKEPERRYESAEALRRDVEQYLAGKPIDAKRDSTWYVLRTTLRRYKLPVAAAGAFVLLLAASSVVTAVLYRRARAEAEKVTQINVFLEDTLGSAEAPAQGELTVAQMLDEGVYWIDLALSGQPEIEAAVRQIIGSAYRNVGRIEEAERELTESLRTRRAVYGDRHPEVARGLSALGLVRLSQHRYEEAEQLFVDALEIRRDAYGPRHLSVAMASNNLANALRLQGRADEARRHYEAALEIRRRERGEHHSDTAMCRFLLGRLFAEQGEARRGLEYHEQALATRRAVLHADHPDLARSWTAVGALSLQLEQFERAQDALGRALERHRRVLGDRHWRTGRARRLYGECLLARQQGPEATEHLRQAQEVLEAALGPDHAETRRAAEVLAGRSDW